MNAVISNWKPTVIFFCLFLMVLSLGIWQIDRGYNKKELENTFLERQSQPVEEIKYNDISASDLYKNVVLEGKFLNQIFFLDNKIFDGKPGVKVFVPFESGENGLIMVSRGWIEFNDRNRLPSIEEIKNPMLVQTINLKEISNYLGKPLSPYILELSELSNSAFTKTWQPINLSSYRHFGYAVQWFGLGLVLIVGYLFFLRKGDAKENE